MMEKFILNNEIVRCRSMIRKVRVRVIRKKIKQINIIKKSKNADPKKLRKAERFVKEVLALKKLREDEVTKFALQHNAGENIPTTTSDHNLAILAFQKDVQEAVTSIKEKIEPGELAKLLGSLGTRSKLKKYKFLNKGITMKDVKDKRSRKKKKVTVGVAKCLEMETENSCEEQMNADIVVDTNANEQCELTADLLEELPLSNTKVTLDQLLNKSKKVKKKPAVKYIDVDDSNQDKPTLIKPIKIKEKGIRNDVNVDKPFFVGTHNNKPRETVIDYSVESVDTGIEINLEQFKPKVTNLKGEKEESAVKEIKVEDPFFVGKKVALPKLLMDEIKEDPTKKVKFSKDDDIKPWRTNYNVTSSKTEREDRFKRVKNQPNKFEQQKQFEAPQPTTEKLHPSWAAKRQSQTIKPFAGKKIKFDAD